MKGDCSVETLGGPHEAAPNGISERAAQAGLAPLWDSLAGQGDTRINWTKDDVFAAPALLTACHYTPVPGDIIMTGTPEGLGQVQVGDTMGCSITAVGSAHIAVRAAKESSGADGKAALGRMNNSQEPRKETSP